MLSYAVKQIVFAPHTICLAMLAAIWLRKTRRRAGTVCLCLITGMCFLLSTKFAAETLAGFTEREPPVSFAQVQFFQPQCIVVLGGGIELSAPEYGGEPSPRADTLERVAYAQFLASQLKVPVLVSGGGTNSEVSEARAMARALGAWGVKDVWLEEESRDTAGNAACSASVLRGKHIKKVIVVTSAFHAPRAKAAFNGKGLEVLMAPTAFYYERPSDSAALSWFPANQYWESSLVYIRALVGELWYQVKG